MTTFLSTLKTTGRSAIVAMLVGAVALGVAPARAEGPGTSITLDMGNKAGEAGMTTMMTQGLTFEDDDFDFYCLSDDEVIWGLEAYGFEDVEIVKYLSNHRVVVWADYGWDEYSMRVRLCTGEVYKIRERH
jgi:hypothetical protein